VEYDRLLHGWQKTRDSALGNGDLPATATTPPFTIDGFTDISFSQSTGWAMRASATYRTNAGWSVEPYYLRWHVGASPLNDAGLFHPQPRRPGRRLPPAGGGTLLGGQDGARRFARPALQQRAEKGEVREPVRSRPAEPLFRRAQHLPALEHLTRTVRE